MVAVDIFRAANGRVVEHWDVMQDDVPAEQTANGQGMFKNPQSIAG
jgi:predicted SnoaL-like aldol condensation-catalyzing enzyme